LNIKNKFFFLIFSPSGHNSIHSDIDEYNNNHYLINSQNAILSIKSNEDNILLNNENEETNNPLLSSSSRIKWIDAVRTVTQLNQVRRKKRKRQMLIRNMRIQQE
jgi:hypothetical protein